MSDYNCRIRTAAVIVVDNKLLMVKHKKKDKEYWLLPGGGVKYGESLSDAIKRELLEELNIKISVGDILFINDSIPSEEERHILNIYFECNIEEGEIFLNHDKRVVDYSFIDLDKIDKILLYPNIKRELLVYLLDNIRDNIYLGNRWDK